MNKKINRNKYNNSLKSSFCTYNNNDELHMDDLNTP